MADLTKAFLEGSRQMAGDKAAGLGNPVSIGNPVGTIGEYDPTSSPVYQTAFSGDKIREFGLKPGQKRGHFGTTVFQPKRNDPEVEAVLGPDVYKQKVSATSADAMRLEQIELKELIRMQAAQIATLTQIVSGGQAVAHTPAPTFMVSHPVSQEIPAHTTTTTNTDADDANDETDYRVIAKANGIKTFGRKKAEVVDELKEKGLM